MIKKPETLEEFKEREKEAFTLLIECRDALPAISLSAARLHNVSLTLDKRIEDWLEPYKVS